MAAARNDEETPASVTIWNCGYREKCSESGCQNLSRLVLRYADGAGPTITWRRPLDACGGRARFRRDRAAGRRCSTIGRVHSLAVFEPRRVSERAPTGIAHARGGFVG
jgi:hypothetical protein